MGNNTDKDKDIVRARRMARWVQQYGIAIDHALLWVAALSLAAFFHLSSSFSHHEALLFSTLVAYCAYLCESPLSTLKTAASLPSDPIDFRRAGLWRWIAINIIINTVLSLLFLHDPCWIYLVMIIATAGWQKYMDGRIPPRLQDSINSKPNKDK